eukprot:9842842-Alexandrium_andersonii.AAC.1
MAAGGKPSPGHTWQPEISQAQGTHGSRRQLASAGGFDAACEAIQSAALHRDRCRALRTPHLTP